jgi:hypothetical protein
MLSLADSSDSCSALLLESPSVAVFCRRAQDAQLSRAINGRPDPQSGSSRPDRRDGYSRRTRL